MAAQSTVADVANDNTVTESFETRYGLLVTTRTPEGYSIQRGEGEKSREVGLVRVKRDDMVQLGWADRAASFVRNGIEGDRREALLDLYR